jgi:hypothetical protein
LPTLRASLTPSNTIDVQFAVGRIHFESLAEYTQYARSIVRAETESLALPRKAVFFGVANPDDRATQLSANLLVQPLADLLAAETPRNSWEIQVIRGEGATKAALSEYIASFDSPTFLFSASHGMGFPNADPRQLPHQGASLPGLPGPRMERPNLSKNTIIPQMISSDARLLGKLPSISPVTGWHT